MTLHPRRVPDWVRDIRDAIEYIHLDVGGLDRQAFVVDGKTVRAVTKSIADIGEAANQIMQSMPHLQTANPDIWQHLRRVYAMRNVLLHGHFRTDASVVWDTVHLHLPQLDKLLQKLES
jgi:uncharacterized protein with HEPN domain